MLRCVDAEHLQPIAKPIVGYRHVFMVSHGLVLQRGLCFPSKPLSWVLCLNAYWWLFVQ